MTIDTRIPASQDFDNDMTLMRRKQVELQSGNSRSTIYLRIAQGTFPAPIQLGARAVAWPQREVPCPAMG
jgi:prophage regulatory protein